MNGFYHEGLHRLVLDLLRNRREWFYSQDYGHVFLQDELRAGVAQILIGTENNYLLNAPEEVGVMCEMAWCAYEIACETVDWNEISLSLRMLQHIDGACKWFRVLAVQEGYGGQMVERYHRVQAPDIRHLNYLFPLGAGDIVQVWEGDFDDPGSASDRDIVWRYDDLVLAALTEWDGIETARQENEGRMAYDDLVVFDCGAYRTGMGTTWVVYNERTFSTWFENEVGQAALRLAFETASNAHYLKEIGHVPE